MRLVTYTFRGTTRLGAVLGDRTAGDTVVDLNRACALHRAERGERRARALADFLVPSDMLSFLQAGEPALDAARAALAHVQEHGRGENTDRAGLVFRLDEPGFRLEAPVVRPGKILAVGVNYKDHAAEAKMELPAHPMIFSKVTTCVNRPGGPIHRPRVSAFLDWEGELCFVIGKHARHVPAARALEHVAGYMIGNDVSVRDWQVHSRTMMMGKGFDTHGPIGPWLVTRDEVPDPHVLDLKTWVNGVIKQDSNTRHLIFGVEALIEYLSQAFTLEPGDVVFTGTPSGVGFARSPREFMKAGDVVRVEITGLGALENPVVEEPEA
ncbi:MAG TPA: fumarylacetoacetate hydrolase family protein [Candidatus Binatus sp.]|nr:fumarylacetoacetate hydrolase family protein [Candidatus Binatus sp.]